MSHFDHRRCRTLFIAASFLWLGILFDSNGLTHFAQAQDEASPDDRLSEEDRRLAAGLIQRRMPELVEEMLLRHPPAMRVYVARAYAAAAVAEKNPTARDTLFQIAADIYQRVIALGTDSTWLHGERRRLDVAQWRVEYGDMILRSWIVPEMDRFEISSGLNFDREKIVDRLRQANEQYAEAGKILDLLNAGLRANEEHYLLLGLAERIVTLEVQQKINRAWASVYLGMVLPSDVPERGQLLADALPVFDTASRTAKESAEKYNALLGVGIALREMSRTEEALTALDRVRNSPESVALTARASYERARTLIRAKRFDAARKELEELTALGAQGKKAGDEGAQFYIELSPLIHAYTYLLEAADNPPTSRRAELEKVARSELSALAEKGGAWPRMIEPYFALAGDKQRSLKEMSDAELSLTADRLMLEKEYAKAIDVLKLLVDHPNSARHSETMFNLGVCHFQLDDLVSAADAFSKVTPDDADHTLAERAIEYAYQCLRRIAARTTKKEDYIKLAETAKRLVKEFPRHRLAAEAGMVAALAFEEADRYSDAIELYAQVPAASVEHWNALHHIARCRQRLCEGLSNDASATRRLTDARAAADAWLKLANELRAMDSSGANTVSTKEVGTSPVTNPAERQKWIEDATLAAAGLLAGDDVRDYKGCLALLGDESYGARGLGLRIRCYQGLNDIKKANAVLDDFLKKDAGEEAGPILVKLVLEMEAEGERLARIGRPGEAKRMANETIPTIETLLRWTQSRSGRQAQTPIVQFELAKTLVQAEKFDEALVQLEELIKSYPDNGNYLYTAAKLAEQLAEMRKATSGDKLAERAESLWAQLLADPDLRDTKATVYWEARYYWLRHRLAAARRDSAHGATRAAEIVKGIETEKAWRPDLGGPPWQSRLLDLANEAREMAEAAKP